ncbi:hypothetical protein [Rhodoferax sp.]|uniref:hypothetical protein n=1 Tax=Rhodoferax sp. TaxID=50421 RepID=UPI002ACE9CB4|nr:hypothetical protein [Rhodoferax sp.]MDZ7921040.1 hypothetical protein [Rhodoferax sp.]
MKVHALLTSLVLLASGAVFAQTTPKDPLATPKIDQREANMEKRVEQGTKSGQLTPHEAKRLNREDALVDHAQAKAAADGVVTAQERKRIGHLQQAQSKEIRQQKHDGQTDLNHNGKRDRKHRPSQSGS